MKLTFLDSDSRLASDNRLVRGANGQVLLLSMRRLSKLVAYCAQYEFEDVIGEVTGADRVEVDGASALDRRRRLYRYARLFAKSHQRAFDSLARPVALRLADEYQLFLPVFNHIYDLFALATVPDWRARCQKAACYITEVWPGDLKKAGYLLDLLTQFDHVFLGTRNSIAELSRLTGRPCTYLPQAADVLRFSPFPDQPARSIDVCNIGRRSAVTHDALCALASNRKLFYYYDTISFGNLGPKQRTFNVQAPAEHRLLLANILRRSRFYLAHRGKVNDKAETGASEEIAARFYEGVAAGALLIGEHPTTADFYAQFDWKDAYFLAPFDCPDMGVVLSELDRDPDRLQRASVRNARQATLRHDWVHRLQVIFDTLALRATPGMSKRAEILATLASCAGDIS